MLKQISAATRRHFSPHCSHESPWTGSNGGSSHCLPLPLVVHRRHTRASNRRAESQKGGRHNGVDERGRIESLIAIPSLSRTKFRRASIRSTTPGWRAFQLSGQRGGGEDDSILAIERPSVPHWGRNDVDLKRHARHDALAGAGPDRRMNPFVVSGEMAGIEGRPQGAPRASAPVTAANTASPARASARSTRSAAGARPPRFCFLGVPSFRNARGR